MATGLVAAAAWAFVTAAPLHAQARPAPALDRALPSLERLDHDAAQRAGNGEMARFFAVHGGAWQVTWDRRSDRPHLIQGQGIPLIPGRGNALRHADLSLAPGQGLSAETVAARALAFLDPWRGLLGVEGMDLRVDPDRSRGVTRPGSEVPHFWNIELQQYFNNIPVQGARVFFRISHGNIVQWGTIQLADLGVNPEPRIDVDDADRRARRALNRWIPRHGREGRRPVDFDFGAHGHHAHAERQGAASAGDGGWRDLRRPHLLVIVTTPAFEPTADYRGVPGLGYGYRLVWRFERLGPDDHRYVVLIDAHTGGVAEVADITDYDDATVRGEVFVDSGTEPAQSLPFPFTAVDHQGDPVTDADGVYDYRGGEARLELDGPFVTMHDSCGGVNLLNDVTGELDLGGNLGTDCSTPGFGGGGNTMATRTVYYNLLRVRSMALPYFGGLPWLQQPLDAFVNINDACNATWNGQSVNFRKSSPADGCANTGEVPDVVFHEWGHGFDNNSGSINSLDKGSGEAFGDTFAMIMSRDGCIGEGFLAAPCATCGDDCTGVRDVDQFVIGGERTIARPSTIEDPDGLDCARFPCPYYVNGFFPYQGPMGYQGHCESQIASSAVVDLVEAMRSEYDEDAWQVFSDIWMTSVVPAQAAFRIASGPRCEPLSEIDGCAADNWYTAFLAADDDDGNLANSTPNACHLYAAFSAHGIACGDPLPCANDCAPQPFPDAGPAQQICLGESIQIGTEARPGHTYAWNPGGSTDAQPTVTPGATTVFEVTASTACGAFSDFTTVFVDDGAGVGLDDEFETNDADGWTLSGLWHLSDGTECVDPSATSGTRALYFGDAGTCNYDTGGRVDGDAISPPVDGIDENSVLRFDYFLEVEEQPDEAFDEFSVAVQAVDSPGWVTVWSRDSRTPSPASWGPAETISLATWAGQTVQVRFRFDSIDGSFNGFRGVLIDNPVITAASDCDYPPRITVASPADGDRIDSGTPVRFSARAADREDGVVTDSLQWTSDVDGALGTGGELTATLSFGPHVITAFAVDSNGGRGERVLQLEVVDATPRVEITEPADGATVEAGEPATLRALASDFEDGDLTAAVVWTSDVDGALGVGGVVSPSLSLGTHLITAAASDGAGQTGQATVTVIAETPPNAPPTVVIVAPGDGAVGSAAAPVSLAAAASDAEDGDLTSAITWTSDLDGALGAGGGLQVTLSVGVHEVTAAVVDGDGDAGAASVRLIVTPDGSAPEVFAATSIAAHDGYVRESSAGSSVGGAVNASGGGSRSLRVGDASGDRQYRSFVSFDTSALPADAQILEVRLELRRGRAVGVDPFTRLGACRLDVATGVFGAGAALEAGDFEAAADAPGAAELSPAVADGELSVARFTAADFDSVNRAGLTQIRLAFEVSSDGNDDHDDVGYWSGEAPAPDRPRLVVTYLGGP